MFIKIPVIIIFRNLYLFKFLTLLFFLTYTYTNFWMLHVTPSYIVNLLYYIKILVHVKRIFYSKIHFSCICLVFFYYLTSRIVHVKIIYLFILGELSYESLFQFFEKFKTKFKSSHLKKYLIKNEN